MLQLKVDLKLWFYSFFDSINDTQFFNLIFMKVYKNQGFLFDR